MIPHFIHVLFSSLHTLFLLNVIPLLCLPPSWDSKGCYLTRSMTLSRGASLTVSSLMAKIWSPGRSLPKEGPSAGHRENCTLWFV